MQFILSTIVSHCAEIKIKKKLLNPDRNLGWNWGFLLPYQTEILWWHNCVLFLLKVHSLPCLLTAIQLCQWEVPDLWLSLNKPPVFSPWGASRLVFTRVHAPRWVWVAKKKKKKPSKFLMISYCLDLVENSPATTWLCIKLGIKIENSIQ